MIQLQNGSPPQTGHVPSPYPSQDRPGVGRDSSELCGPVFRAGYKKSVASGH